jgi:cation diffusion facilitator family transporter
MKYKNIILFLTLLKLFVGLLSGSISILSETIYSGMNRIAPMVAYTSARMPGESPDMHTNPGEYDEKTGLITAVLIISAGLIIVYAVVHRLLYPYKFEPSLLLLGIIVMGIYAVLDLFIFYPMMKLEGDTVYFRTLMSPSLEVMMGLIFVYLTNIAFLDLLIPIYFTVSILKTGFSLAKKSYYDLIDYSLSEEEKKEIEEIILQYKGNFVHMHDLQTRWSEPGVLCIEFHLLVEANMSVHDGQALLGTIENALFRAYPNSTVTMHLEKSSDERQWG